MPIFEFECRGCRHQFEHLSLPGSTATPVCPECGGSDLERLQSGFAVNSAEISHTRVETARKQIARSKDTKDRQVARADYEKAHREEH